MLELHKSERAQTDSAVGLLLEGERKRNKKMALRRAAENRTRVKMVLDGFQKRFSRNVDMPNEIEEMVEAQVQQRTRDLFRQANFDPLTHLPNRAYFGEALETVLENAQKNSGVFSLLFLDLDGFKAVNDSLGHQAGDELLQNVGARLVSSVREGDIVSRRGGDEFVILLTDLDGREDIANICQRIIDEVSRPYWIGQSEARVSTSIGVARYPQEGKTASELMEHSDSALYVSKSNGRRTFRFYNEIEFDVAIPSSRLQEQLAKAIEAGEIEACLEPQIELKSGQVVGASLSARWLHEELENPYLESWQDILVKSGQAPSLATWLIDSALYYLKQWQTTDQEWVVSVPVLDSLWLHQDLPEFLEQRLRQYGVCREQLQLEFSLASMQNVDGKLKQTLIELGEAGYQLTLTDVGAYPLDLALLSTLKLNEVKLDRHWMLESMQSKSGQAWLQGLIQMAKSLDLCVIASGVQNAEQIRQLCSWGCLMGQGEVWSKPQSAERFNQHLMVRHRLGA